MDAKLCFYIYSLFTYKHPYQSIYILHSHIFSMQTRTPPSERTHSRPCTHAYVHPKFSRIHFTLLLPTLANVDIHLYTHLYFSMIKGKLFSYWIEPRIFARHLDKTCEHSETNNQHSLSFLVVVEGVNTADEKIGEGGEEVI